MFASLIIYNTKVFARWTWTCVASRPYGGVFAVRKVVGSRFIIVSGNLSYGTVQEFLSEFYHPSHSKGSLAQSIFHAYVKLLFSCSKHNLV